jgi:tetratricopeptide (TPR) repeat protein
MLSSASSRLQIELRLKFDSGAARSGEAWMIPGDESRVWLNEIARWKVSTDRLQLAVIATAGCDDQKPQVCGVLVWSTADFRPVETQVALPYARLAGRLYLPAESTCEPSISESELADLLPVGLDCFVWHPAAGLIGYESSDCLTVSSLLSTEPQSESAWNHGAPGVIYPQRLLSLKADATPIDFLNDGGEDIGTDSDSIQDLPRSDGEQQGSKIKKALSGFKEKIAKSVSKMTGDKSQDQSQSASQDSGAGTNPDQSGVGSASWTDKLRSWASRVMSESMQRRREGELERLMELLQSDPDAGLRKALPFNDSVKQRGLGNPGSGLFDRDPVYNPNNLSGLGDYWHVSFEMQMRLIARYRELANREMRLRRYRRAAYIFAELLSDYPSAARALEAGGFFLEAAALFRDHLLQPLEAASCLERGGLIHQAIEIYVEEMEYESAARLYAQIDQHDTARDFWSRAIDKACQQKRFIDAARIAQVELHDDEFTLSLLATGWTSQSKEARNCLAEWIELSGSLGNHDAVSRRIESLKALRTHADRAEMAAHVLGQVAHRYPDDTVKSQAKDAARVIASAQLMRLNSNRNSRLWLDRLSELEPDDQLLQRDCDRYHDQLIAPRQERKTATIPARSDRKRSLIPVSTWNVPNDQRIVKAASSQQALHLITESLGERRINLWRIPWSNMAELDPRRHRLAYWEFMPIGVSIAEYVLLAPDPRDQRPPLVHIVGQRPLLMPKSLLGWPFRPSRRAAWLDDLDTLGITQDGNGIRWHFANAGSHFKLEALDDNDIPINSLLWPIPIGEMKAVDCTVQHKLAFVQHGQTLCAMRLDQSSSEDVLTLESVTGGFAVSPPLTRGRFLVGDATGVDLYFVDQWDTPERIITMDSPKVAFTCDALMVAAGIDRCVVMEQQQHSIVRVAESDWMMESAIQSVHATNKPQSLACVSGGSVAIWKIR